MLNTKVFKHIGFALKVIIALASVGYIILKLRDFDPGSGNKGIVNLLDFGYRQFIIILFVLALMLVNWGLEVFKWKILVSKHEEISSLACVKSVLAGVTMSVFTPNRVGEFGGKIFFLKTANRAKALVSSMLGSFVQVSMTVLFGAIGLSVYFFILDEANDPLPVSEWWLYVLWGVTILLFVLIMMPITKVREGKLSKYLEVITYYESNEKIKVVMLSFLRYLVFTTQFMLLLYVFPLEISFIEALGMIMLTFLGITLVPTVTIAELGVRGTSALLFLGMYEPNHAAVLYATFLLWIINIALPALIGVPFVFSLTFFRSGNK